MVDKLLRAIPEKGDTEIFQKQKICIYLVASITKSYKFLEHRDAGQVRLDWLITSNW